MNKQETELFGSHLSLLSSRILEAKKANDIKTFETLKGNFAYLLKICHSLSLINRLDVKARALYHYAGELSSAINSGADYDTLNSAYQKFKKESGI